jgi:hypothetical protein
MLDERRPIRQLRILDHADFFLNVNLLRDLGAASV